MKITFRRDPSASSRDTPGSNGPKYERSCFFVQRASLSFWRFFQCLRKGGLEVGIIIEVGVGDLPQLGRNALHAQSSRECFPARTLISTSDSKWCIKSSAS